MIPTSSTARVLIALVLAAVSGLVFAEFAPQRAAAVADVLQPFGKLWINALQMTVVPLVGALVTLGVGTARDAAASGRLARRALIVFLLLLTFAAAIAALIAPAVFNMFPRNPELVQALASSSTEVPKTPAVADWLGSIIPSNAVNAAAQGAMLPLVVFSLFFGFALTRIDHDRAQRVFELLHGIADAMTQIVRWVLVVAPLGVFALVFSVTARAGIHTLTALAVYLLTAIGLYLLVAVAMYVVVVLAGRDSLPRFIRAAVPAQAVAMSTQSSLASLPAMLDTTLGTLGHPRRVPSLVLPMAVSLFRLTSPVQYMVVAAFIAWAHGTDVPMLHWAVGVALAVVVSLGSIGLPGQASFMITNLPITQSLGLPVEPLGVLMALDTIPDVFATLGNVTGDLAAENVAARGEVDDPADA
ncbi:dicarboxylate/amino acid:cation symporter [Solilutibacter silvestris]|uniref:dicarboxylate/amino acid:cation symporter n=1 Tax=Solilutibacter silvestris TaxID=1645665 RepID=UPI003D34DA65